MIALWYIVGIGAFVVSATSLSFAIIATLYRNQREVRFGRDEAFALAALALACVLFVVGALAMSHAKTLESNESVVSFNTFRSKP